MSKELEALKRIVKALTYDCPITEDSELDKAIKLVETALKRGYVLSPSQIDETDFVGVPIKEYDLTQKKIKALEIIKSKEMLSVFKDINGKCYLAFNTTAIEIPQEEYDLLKELLEDEQRINTIRSGKKIKTELD